MELYISRQDDGRRVMVQVAHLGTLISSSYGKTDAKAVLQNLKNAVARLETYIEIMPEQRDVREEALLDAKRVLEEVLAATRQ